jgi:hypothetical protein
LKKLASANIVIVAKNLNPSIFSQLWLVEEGIIGKDEFGENCVFAPMVTQVFAPGFQLHVLPERLQVMFIDESLEKPDPVIGKVIKIAQKLPHIPYVAIGANFLWFAAPESPTDPVEFMRKVFVKPEMPLYRRFSSEDARFGTYMSKDIFGARMKLDIKPHREEKNGNVDEYLRFSFNFHLGLEHGDHVDQILRFLRNWGKMIKETHETVSDALKITGC